jgi:hypothetical protein
MSEGVKKGVFLTPPQKTQVARIYTERCVAGMRPKAESCVFWV